MNRFRLFLLLLILLLVGLFLSFDLQRFLTLEFLKAQQAAITEFSAAHPLRAAALYALLYVVVTGLSLPGAAVLTLAGGAVFGLLWGTLLVSFVSTIGATLAFLAARFLLRDLVKARFGEKMQAINAGIAREGVFYLISLRLVPVFPFFMINLAMGLTDMGVGTFFWASQLGMFLGTLAYINAGTQLGQIESLSGILSPGVLASFALLGVLPIFSKRLIEKLRANKVYARWQKPSRFDRNLVVIGAGSAGLVSAYIAAAVKARVTLVEKHRMGGDCLNTGCVPSKTMIRSAKLLGLMRRSAAFGICAEGRAEIDFAALMERIQSVVKRIEPHDSAARYTGLGVEVLDGEAKILSPWQVQVSTQAGARVLTTRSIIVATGAEPFVPPIPGIEQSGYLTSDTIWQLRELPKRLLVLGGGPIGCELAQCFARFGSQVTLIERLPRLLMREDAEVSEFIQGRFREDGVDLRLGHQALRFTREDGRQVLVIEADGNESAIPFDALLVAVGRSANTRGFGLEELGIELPAHQSLPTNEFLQIHYPNIYACGDVAGPYQFTHMAGHQAWHATVNALFGGWRKFRVDYSSIPWATFTDPEVARVGLNEQEAREKNVSYEVSRFGFEALDRAITDEATAGFVKILTAPGKDRILGVTLVGEQAGDLIAEFVLAMKLGIGLNKLLGTIHIYPTYAEANQRAAGVWKRSHAPEGLLRLLQRYHAWRLGGRCHSADQGRQP